MTASKRPVRRLRPAREQPPNLAEAIDAFLAQPDLALSSRRSYVQTLGRLRRELGPERPLQWLSGRDLERAVVTAWGGCAPATWNRHVATLRSFSALWPPGSNGTGTHAKPGCRPLTGRDLSGYPSGMFSR